MNEKAAISRLSKGQYRHTLSRHASEDSAGAQKNNPAYLNSSVTYFPLLTCFVMIFSHGRTIVSDGRGETFPLQAAGTKASNLFSKMP